MSPFFTLNSLISERKILSPSKIKMTVFSSKSTWLLKGYRLLRKATKVFSRNFSDSKGCEAISEGNLSIYKYNNGISSARSICCSAGIRLGGRGYAFWNARTSGRQAGRPTFW